MHKFSHANFLSILTFDSLLGTLHEDSSRTWMQRRIRVPVLRLALTDMLQIINANPTLWQVLLQVARGALRSHLLAPNLWTGVDATAILVPHVPM